MKRFGVGCNSTFLCPSLLEELGEGSLGLDSEKPPVPLLSTLCSHGHSAEAGSFSSRSWEKVGSAWHRHLCLGGHQHTGAAALRPVGEISLLCPCQISAHNLVLNMSARLLDFIS